MASETLVKSFVYRACLEPALFQPMAQAPSAFVYITAKTAGPPLSITPGVRRAVMSLNADLPLFWVQSFDDAIAPSFVRLRVLGPMFMIFGVDAHDPLIFGGVAAVLALVGLIACIVPAARATLIDPLVALRAE